MNDQGFSRRSVLRSAGAAGAGLGIGALGTGAAQAATSGAAPAPAQQTAAAAPPRRGKSMIGVPFEQRSTVRVGIIGLGQRGGSMIDLFLALDGVRVTALCDPVKEKAERAAKKVTDANQPAPALYVKGDHDFEKLVRRGDIDFVYVATPWDWHYEMAAAALKGGKHVGIECPLALELKQLWELVDLSERTRRHCMQLENCAYGQNEMRVLRMAHEGLFGDLLHSAGAYIHDLRELMFDPEYYEGPWRRLWHTRMKGDLYPNHGFGPAANYMDVNRGDRAVRITSFGSPSLGLAAYREENMPAGHESWKETYIKSDMTISLVQTEKGRVIRLEQNVSNPHPYDRLNILGGTKGVFEDYPPRIYLEPEMSGHEWGDFDKYKDHDHWLWKEHANPPGGHGGMDYIMLFRLMQCMRLGLVPDFDVYDAATWSAPVPLSHASIKAHGTPQEFPDFTRGGWRKKREGIDSSKPEE
ncbi:MULTISPECIES: Gfo/Idh/MocA family protein [Streptomyces]|uniref:Gfo/Idh/MocA family protein n=1 Tax=Streptomyces TaxID=1883 RepID=UPI0004C8C9FB|nr:Gfo/Idh/MocA family oxidoreductase [Streptomyces sp. NRRL S-1868]